ncbi:MAG TPA: hypothetical protein PKV16_03180 [Caldisericia bacterium]|nr:hypothetical protein [Caldisericia bacterium]HPF48314.1 hypothetical protein [Caldisericia bacterium]HPI83507.1 hypothetical protein [Caldisericia bacterium]HPQ92767.1 hypothetical protein [Caldisericia bacterium]HRV74135.1 hypothetical protein [Caldisericia bacterium]
MMKHTALFIVAILLLSSFLGCAGGDVEETVDTDDSGETLVINYPDEEVTNSKSSYYEADFTKVDIPSNWHIGNETNDLITISPSTPDESANITSVTITRMGSDGVFKAYDYAEMTASGLKQSNIQKTMIGDIEWIEVWGNVADNLLWQFVRDGKDGNIIQVSITAFEPTMSDEINSLIKSLQETD